MACSFLIADEAPKELEKKPEMEQVVPKEEKAPEYDLNTGAYENAFIKTILVLIGLLALVILTIWMFRKMSHSRVKQMNHLRTIKVIEKRPLSPKSMLYLIEVSGKQILLSESQLEVRSITSLDYSIPEKTL